jgi:hypothetical protein
MPWWLSFFLAACGGTSTVDGGAIIGNDSEPPTRDSGRGIDVVHDCASLAAPGVFESIAPPVPSDFVLPEGRHVSVAGVAVEPRAAGVVYLSTSTDARPGGFGLWRSEDCGATWSRVATGRNADAINSGSQYTILFDPRDPNVLISQSFYGTGHLYRSTNRGADWDDISPSVSGAPSFVQVASMDPTDPDHLIVTFHEDCGPPASAMCLAETHDGGASWRLVNGPPSLDAWVEAAGPIVIGGDRWLLPVQGTAVFFTEDAGATWETVLEYPGCYARLVSDGGRYYLGCKDHLGIQVSDDGRTWTHVPSSPAGSGLVHAGGHWFSSYVNDTSGQPFYRATDGDLSSWTRLDVSSRQGAGTAVYDETHHVAYFACSTAGLWRTVSE